MNHDAPVSARVHLSAKKSLSYQEAIHQFKHVVSGNETRAVDVHSFHQSILLLVGTRANAGHIAKYLPLNLAKMYYARRHDHRFKLLLSQQYSSYFPDDLWVVRPSHSPRTLFFASICS